MLRISSTFLLVLVCSFTIAQSRYSKVKIDLHQKTLNELIQLGIGIDHGEFKANEYFISDFSEADISILENNEIQHEILIDDVSSYYVNRNLEERISNSNTGGCNNAEDEFEVPEGFELGDMGGFFTYQEFLDHVDTMFARYPNLITQKAAIDTFLTHEGRPVYWLKISDNPNTNESEPEVLYTAVHHAREAASLSQTIMYMYYLLENYGTNEEVTNIVNNTEMYFIPMINPDGYIHNENNNPNGGGMWRKNKRNNGDGTNGVDLNRNYGHAWGLDDNGSSPDPSSDTYRGPAPFSEPELLAVKHFCESHEFRMALNYHTYGNLLIYPWGFQQSFYTPDSAQFVEFAKVLTESNNYKYGTGDQTVGYVTNGDSDDWMYGEQSTKGKILSFTPEAGDNDDGFWPTTNRIIPISLSNIRQNLNLANLVLKFGRVTDLTNNRITALTSSINFEIQRLGLDSPATFTVGLTPLSNNITSVGNNVVYTGMSLLETRQGSITLNLDASITAGDEISFLLTTDNGDFVTNDTIHKVFGEGISVLSENGDNTNHWQTNNWGISTTHFYSAGSSITDSPQGDYNNGADNPITTINSINLNAAVDATLNFWARWEIETGWDYVQILASIDGGGNWSPLCGKYTKSGNSNQELNEPIYDGFQLNWVFEEISLNDYLGEVVTLQFRLKADGGVREDGFYYDDLNVKIIDQASAIESKKLLPKMVLFPNPTSNEVFIKNLPKNSLVTIINTLGQQVLSQKIVNGNVIPVMNLPKGVYHVMVNDKLLDKLMIK